MKKIEVIRSFVAGDALAALIAQEYDLGGPVRCQLFSKLIRTQDNDHYLVRVGKQKYVARVYQQGDRLKRTEGDYLFELDWLNFLHENDMPVTYPIPRRDGRFLGRLQAPEGLRYYVLFNFAEGKPLSLDDRDELFVCGAQMARIHKMSNNYENPHKRAPMDLKFLVDKPVERLTRLWQNDDTLDENLDTVLMAASEAKAEMLEILENEDNTDDGWGLIGGDFHHGSTFITDDRQITFFNFDWCGYGWRAYDIATFLLNTNLMHLSEEMTDAFFAGYYSERPLSSNEHAAISPLLTIRRVWMTTYFTKS